MVPLATALLVAATVLAALSAGFFYTWSFTVMRGLDAAGGASAIAAMNGVNSTIQNAWFAPVFFGPALLTAASAAALFIAGRPLAASLALAAFVLYGAGVVAVTLAVNVPMNTALLEAPIPTDPEAADAAWRAYSERWTLYNHVRTGASLGAFLALLAALRAP